MFPSISLSPGSVDKDILGNTDGYDVRFLVNIVGIISFDSPFYGLMSSVVTQTGVEKATWIAKNSPKILSETIKTVFSNSISRSGSQAFASVIQKKETVVTQQQPTTSSNPATATTTSTTTASYWNYAMTAGTLLAGAGAAVGFLPGGVALTGAIASRYAYQVAEEARSHLEFLYPLVNSKSDMGQRMEIVRHEMDQGHFLFRGIYLSVSQFLFIRNLILLVTTVRQPTRLARIHGCRSPPSFLSVTS